MSYSSFTERKQRPSDEEIRQVLGASASLYEELAQSLRETYAPDEDLHYLYGRRYGWALRFMLHKRLLVNLYPNQGFFFVQVNLPESAVQEALLWNDLDPRYRAVIENAPVYSEGRWLWFPVENQSDLPGIRRLIDLRERVRK